MSVLDEFGLIDRLTARLPELPGSVSVGIGDDCAVVDIPAGMQLLLTTDTMVQGVHFLPSTMSWVDVGYKALMAAVSDLAAMGGRPLSAAISLAVPKAEFDVSWLDLLYDGVGLASLETGCPIVGGDVVGTAGPLVITVMVTGVVPRHTALLRSGANPGDMVFVTGTVGASAAGLEVLQHPLPFPLPVDERIALIHCHQRPQAQLLAGEILRLVGATSCNDVSDGLASELHEIANASHVRLRIDEQRIPLLPALKNFARRVGKAATEYAWYGGEDYQLVGTATSFAFAQALSRCESLGLKLTQIGRVEAGDGVIAETARGYVDISLRGYNHFK